jgi:hypothetical protein
MEVMEEAGHAGIEGYGRLAGLGIRIRGERAEGGTVSAKRPTLHIVEISFPTTW